PKSVLSIPRLGAINVHAFLLPRHRGAAPIARAILAGDPQTGVSIMKMDELLDHGPVLATAPTPIGEREDAVSLTSRLAELGAETLMVVMNDLPNIKTVDQDHSKATVTPKLSREEAQLGWDTVAHKIDRCAR